MSKPWFDPDSGQFKLDEYVAETPSYQRILADGTVTEQEFRDHAERTHRALRDLEARLPEDVRDAATEALCELAVLYALNRHLGPQA